MSKNIVIQEGGQPKILSNVSKLRTSEQGGGSCTWIPEDELAKYKVGSKRIIEDGVYNAEAEDGLYGYSEVTVDTSRRIRPKRITENGEYHADDEDLRGYSDVIVSVPSDIHNTRKRITENGEYNADDEGFTGYSTVTVAVPPGRTRSKRISENGTFKASDEELEGYSEVTVNVPNGRLKSKTIVANGEYTASEEDAYGYSQIRVNVPQEGRYKIKNITDNGDYNASDDECSGYSSVHVNVPQQGRTASKTITENGTYAASDDELIGFSQVNVRVPQVGKTAVKSITENGTYEAKNESLLGYSSVRVNVQKGKLIAKTITANGTYQIADEGDRTAYGYNRINVSVPVQGSAQGQLRTKTIRENGTYTASGEGEGVIGFSSVTVNVDGGKLGSKSITANGTYMASDDNLYGFRSVSVRVPGSQGSADSDGRPTMSNDVPPGGIGSSVIGRDTSGVISGGGGNDNEYAIGIDSNGSIVATSMPSSIEIIENPTKTTYTDGEAIDIAGAVVVAKKADGSLWENGYISLGELTIDPSIAAYTTDGTITVDIDVDGTSKSLTFAGPSVGDVWTTWTDPSTVITEIDGSPIVIKTVDGSGYTREYFISSSPFMIKYARRNGWYVGSVSGRSSSGTRGYYVYNENYSGDMGRPYPSNPPYSLEEILDGYDAAQDKEGSASQAIAIKWRRPADGKELTDGFSITVRGSASGSTEGGS